jgi:signal transduction histidine kinase
VQESLANAARHAPGSAVEVVVAYEPRLLRLVVTNGPPPVSVDGRPSDTEPEPSRGQGHGLPGMAERATVVGGHVRAGATPEGGFQVTAELPNDGEKRR